MLTSLEKLLRSGQASETSLSNKCKNLKEKIVEIGKISARNDNNPHFTQIFHESTVRILKLIRNGLDLKSVPNLEFLKNIPKPDYVIYKISINDRKIFEFGHPYCLEVNDVKNEENLRGATSNNRKLRIKLLIESFSLLFILKSC
jgi:hypothetical protein